MLETHKKKTKKNVRYVYCVGAVPLGVSLLWYGTLTGSFNRKVLVFPCFAQNIAAN